MKLLQLNLFHANHSMISLMTFFIRSIITEDVRALLGVERVVDVHSAECDLMFLNY